MILRSTYILILVYVMNQRLLSGTIELNSPEICRIVRYVIKKILLYPFLLVGTLMEQDKNFLVAFSHGNRVILILQQIKKQKNMVVGGPISNRLPPPPPPRAIWTC